MKNTPFYLLDLNKTQQEVAMLSHNAAVSAGAGSGKTMVLSKRFVYLILEKKIKIEKILALTFTKKAATEMQERCYRELSSVRDKCENETQKKLIDEALKNFSQANISTLDSFCGQIARAGCIQFGIAPDFIIDKNRADEIERECALKFFMKYRNDIELAKLITPTQINTFIYDYFISFLKYTSLTRPLNIEECKKRFLQECDTLLNTLLTDFCTSVKTILDYDNSTQSKKLSHIQDMLSQFSTVSILLDDVELDSFFTSIQEIYKINLTGLPNQTSDVSIDEFKNNVKHLRDALVPRLLILKQHYDQKDFIFHCFDILGLLQTEVNNLKVSEGVLNHNDVSQLALDCLLSDKQLRQLYKSKFDSIMIDEFQDNNSLQRDLLFVLSEKTGVVSQAIPDVKDLCDNKLFFVGDEKQSIYLFRGADVSVFKNLSLDFSGNHNLALDTNYRSEKSLIDFFNHIFPNVFSIGCGRNAPDYEANFAKILYDKNTSGVLPQIDVLVSCSSEHDGINYLDGYDAESYSLANKIRTMINEKITVSENNRARSCKYSDFAILFRTTSEQHRVEKYLRLCNIPYKAVQQHSIFNEAPINDMLAIIRLAISPDDRFTYTQVLRSPFCNLTDEIVLFLLLQKNTDELFDAKDLQLSEIEEKQLIRIQSLYKRIQIAVHEKTSTQIISQLWYEEGYRYFLLQDNKYTHYLELYDYLFEIARQCDLKNMSVHEFLELVESYTNKQEKLDDMEIPVGSLYEDDNTVKLLSIHKSKGLQYKIVFIPFCASFAHLDTIQPIIYSPEYGLSISIPNFETGDKKKQNIFYDMSKELIAKKNTSELKRLLYVALTRTECHIILTGIKKINRKKSDEISFYELLHENFSVNEKTKDEYDVKAKTRLSFYDIIFSALTDEVLNNTKHVLHIEEIKPIAYDKIKQIFFNTSESHIEQLLKLKNFEKKEFSTKYKKILSASHLQERETTEKTFFETNVESELSATDLGILAHTSIEARFKNTLIKTPSQVAPLIQKMTNLFFDSQIGKMALMDNNRKIEYSFITKYNGEIIVGKADLIFEHDDVLYIVDYKTDKVEIPEEHRMQLSVYKHACANLFNKDMDKVKTVLFYLRTGHVSYLE